MSIRRECSMCPFAESVSRRFPTLSGIVRTYPRVKCRVLSRRPTSAILIPFVAGSPCLKRLVRYGMRSCSVRHELWKRLNTRCLLPTLRIHHILPTALLPLTRAQPRGRSCPCPRACSRPRERLCAPQRSASRQEGKGYPPPQARDRTSPGRRSTQKVQRVPVGW